MNSPKVIVLPAELANAVASNLDDFILYYNFLENQCSTEEGKAHARHMSTAFKLYREGLMAAAR